MCIYGLRGVWILRDSTSRDSTTSCRLVISDYLFWILRDYALDISRLLVTSRLFIFWILRDYALDTSGLLRKYFFRYMIKPYIDLPINALKLSLSIGRGQVIAIACDKKENNCYYTSTICKHNYVRRLTIRLYKVVGLYNFYGFILKCRQPYAFVEIKHIVIQ